MINKVTLLGHLGKDPEKTTLPSGVSYCRFSLATNESYKDNSGEWKEKTEWHNIVMWRDLAERAEKQLKKGSLVYLEGKITTNSWQDQDGKTQYRTEIVVNIFKNLEKSEKSGSSYTMPPPSEVYAGTVSSSDSQKTADDAGEDDLPF